MKLFFAILLFVFYCSNAFAQWELSTGYAINKNDASGAPIHLAYDFKLTNKLYTKTQVGYKHLYRFNDFVGATLDANSFEVHQTFSYKLVDRRKYILKPNIGVNYRWYTWKGKMLPPYNSLPQRAWVLDFRNHKMILTSYDSGFSDNYSTNNWGFSIQLQNQFRLSEKIWLHITPFIEPDYDGYENIGGCYVGVIWRRR